MGFDTAAAGRDRIPRGHKQTTLLGGQRAPVNEEPARPICQSCTTWRRARSARPVTTSERAISRVLPVAPRFPGPYLPTSILMRHLSFVLLLLSLGSRLPSGDRGLLPVAVPPQRLPRGSAAFVRRSHGSCCTPGAGDRPKVSRRRKSQHFPDRTSMLLTEVRRGITLKVRRRQATILSSD